MLMLYDQRFCRGGRQLCRILKVPLFAWVETIHQTLVMSMGLEQTTVLPNLPDQQRVCFAACLQQFSCLADNNDEVV